MTMSWNRNRNIALHLSALQNMPNRFKEVEFRLYLSDPAKCNGCIRSARELHVILGLEAMVLRIAYVIGLALFIYCIIT